MNADKHG